MKKLKSFSLVSDFQCSEVWDNMTPTNTGRFCDSCSKEVIDIRGMSSERIRELASVHRNGFCARAAPIQFRTYPEPQKENSGVLAACFSVMAALASFGSEANTPETEDIVLVEKDEEALPSDTLWVEVQLYPSREDLKYWNLDLIVRTKWGSYIPNENNFVKIPFLNEDSSQIEVYKLGYEFAQKRVLVNPVTTKAIAIEIDDRIIDVFVLGHVRVEEDEEPVYKRFWPRTDELRTPPQEESAQE